MRKSVSLGGDRLGSGNRMNVSLHGYESSNHDLGYVWRSTMAAGTLVPFLCEVALPGDNFRIDLDSVMKTHPTVGPLLGSFKAQFDVFKCPIRLYHSRLHNNPLGIGMETDKIKFPILNFTECNIINLKDKNTPPELQQINPSSIFSYLGLNGFGSSEFAFSRNFNGLPFVMYWDIYKNYYVDKQSGKGVVIHSDPKSRYGKINHYLIEMNSSKVVEDTINPPVSEVDFSSSHIYIGNWCNTYGENYLIVDGIDLNDPEQINFSYEVKIELNTGTQLFSNLVTNYKNLYKHAERRVNGWKFYGLVDHGNSALKEWSVNLTAIECAEIVDNKTVQLKTFDLDNLDLMRQQILQNDPNTAFVINDMSPEPYSLPFVKWDTEPSVPIDVRRFCCSQVQEGLAIKTYQSDIFNNILNTELIDGENGINEITAIDTSSGSFTVDQFNLSNKIYNMLNRIVAAGNSYKDYLETVYDVNVYLNSETPQWCGGMSKELVFQEITSAFGNQEDNPLGSLAGKGQLLDGKKGGHINIRVDEPCYIIGIVSLTPRLDYSQFNRWDVNLESIGDLHRPALDQIGYQDLLAELMHSSTTYVDNTGKVIPKSVGKTVAWINYMTNFNRVHGNFADSRNEMFMTLCRRYELEEVDPESPFDYRIKDQTTYIDPSKFNYIFAQTELDAQNFWVQIGINMNVRRKMSAKMIPNL